MASEWRSERFGRMAVLIRDPIHPSEAAGLPYVGLEHIGEDSLQLVGAGVAEDATSLKSRFEAGDILFGKLRPYFRKVVRAPFAGICSTDIWVVRPQPCVDAGFLFYLMASELFVEPVVRASEGTKMPRAKWEYAATLELPLPPLPEQRAIAHILGTLDDKIELNRRMSETLEQMARALFKSWFVDFEPVRAKMEGRWRRGESLPGLPAHLYDLFPDRLVDSELGEIPEGWRVVPLTELIEVNPPRSLKRGQVAPYLDMASMPTRGHVPDNVVARPFTSGMRFINGDTLLARITPCLENGKTAFVDFLEDREVGWGSTEYIVLRPKPPLPGEFAYCLARSQDFRDFSIQSMTGTSGRQRVQAEALSHYMLVSPRPPVAEAFGRMIKPLFAKSTEAICESRTVAGLRNALLPKLISGQIRMRDAEKFLEERGL